MIETFADACGTAHSLDEIGRAGTGFADTDEFARYFRFMVEHGFMLAPSQFEAMFISTAHSDEQLDETVAAVREFLG